MNDSIRLATESRDSHLALRRVERQQLLIEHLHAAHGRRVPLALLAHELHVSGRTVARDVERLRLSGVPIETHRGGHGGVSLPHAEGTRTVALDLPELAALISSLAVLGPSASESASSAMRKLAEALGSAPARSSTREAPQHDSERRQRREAHQPGIEPA